jgi:hypothetical protein
MRTFLSIAFLASLSLGVSLPAMGHSRITTEVTWSEHIRPIFAKKCMRCHRPNGPAPEYVDLTRYGTDTEPGARAWAVAIEEEILSGNMPPWNADDRFTALVDHTKLSTMEKDYIIAWIQGGAPQGPKKDLPTPEEFTKSQWQFGKPDIVLGYDKPFVLEEDKDSDSVRYTFTVELEEDTYITGYEFLVDYPRFVRSIKATVSIPVKIPLSEIRLETKLPYDPLLEDEELVQERYITLNRDSEILGQWLKGSEAVLYPEGAGRYLQKGSIIQLEIIYERPVYAEESGNVSIQSKLGLFKAKENEIIDLLIRSRENHVHFIGRPDINYPELNQTKQIYELKEDIHMISLQLSPIKLHKTIKDNKRPFKIYIKYPDGHTLPLVLIPHVENQHNYSFQFKHPVAIPRGAQFDVVAHSFEKFHLTSTYYLNDHIYVEPIIIPKTVEKREGTGMRLGVFGDLGSDSIDTPLQPETDSEVYWCPMRGNPCGFDDYKKGDTCKDCEMDVEPRAEFFEGLDRAPAQYDWALSKRGRDQTYWCVNRGREDHGLEDYARTGECTVCKEPLKHRTQFKDTRTYMCMVPDCESYQQKYYGPGLCEGCGQPAAGLGHMDHTPLHGGWQFFMADNLYHHLEGTMPEEGVFKLYLYDDWKTPLDARNFKGALFIESEDATTGEFTETEYPLSALKEGDTWMTATIPTEFPIDFYITIWLAGEEKRYDFSFEKVTVEPAPSVSAQGAFRLHSHRCDTPDIPQSAEDIAKEILKRDKQISAHIKAKDWLSLHCPAEDSKILTAALQPLLNDRSASDKVRMKKLVGMVNRSTLALDYAGDIGDSARVSKAYDEYAEAIVVLKNLFPTL